MNTFKKKSHSEFQVRKKDRKAVDDVKKNKLIPWTTVLHEKKNAENVKRKDILHFCMNL